MPGSGGWHVLTSTVPPVTQPTSRRDRADPVVSRPDQAALSPLLALVRCLECGAPVELTELAERPGYPHLGPDGWLTCAGCGESYPLIAGTARMLDRDGRADLGSHYPRAGIRLPSAPPAERGSVRHRTAESFAYEWEHFGHPRPEWRKNFVDYLQPHSPESLAGRLVLDVGTGSGRHSAQAAVFGARVVAVDLGRSIDVARRNLPVDVLTVQADAEQLPFALATFDLVMSIGVLHHLPDPERALRRLVCLIAPGGRAHIYLYRVPERSLHRRVLRGVTAARAVTVGMSHHRLHRLCYPLAIALWVSIVLPYRILRSLRAPPAIAEALPLKTYADYPVGVLVNDTFDRFSAPIEHRFTAEQVRAILQRAGLNEITVLPHHGWIGDGAVPPGGAA
jgi:2-polyprenyl-3-methyl-5-hydroxy-6-metoxy-1,4-benzoquinol methylase